MSIIKTATAYRGSFDHFEPEKPLDAAEQRQLRGHLERIDFAAFAAKPGGARRNTRRPSAWTRCNAWLWRSPTPAPGG